MDGHGPTGHYASDYFKNSIRNFFADKTAIMKNMKDKDITELNIYTKLKNKDYKIIKNFYQDLDDKLKEIQFDILFSSATSVIVVLILNRIICTNIGNSRELLIYKEGDNYLMEQLSFDHIPNEPKEEISIHAKRTMKLENQ